MTAQLSMRLNGKETTQLTILYNSDHGCCWQTFSVFSGASGYKNDPSQTAEKGKGPLPKGRYYVVDRPTGGSKDWIRENIIDFDGRTSWFALFKIDGNINDFTMVDGVRRGNFRMHPRSRSAGCVTFSNTCEFYLARKILLEQSPTKVPNTSLDYYGVLFVT